jgi:microcystin-dependent protein
MTYPALYQRMFNFLRDKNNGLESPDPAKLDIELDAIQVTLAMCRDRLKSITSADGRLRNVPQPLAAALVGTWEGVGTGVTTVTTTIPWQPAFSINSMLILANSAPLRPSQLVSVQDDGGFLEITFVNAPSITTTLVVWAHEPGAGLLTRLADTTTGEGASLIGIEDATGLLDADNVEDAIAETAAEFSAFQTEVGDLALYFKTDGSRPAVANWDMAGFKVTNAGDGTADGDYITLRQIAGYISVWSDLQRFYLKRDGSTAMAGALNFGNNKGYNLADPDLNQPLDAVNVRSMLRSLSTSGAAPVGLVSAYAGALPPSADWLVCDGGAYSDSAYPVLTALLGGAYKPPGIPAQGCVTAQVAFVASGDLSAGVLVTMPPVQNDGAGYEYIPQVVCVNPGGGVTSATFNVAFVDGLQGSIDGSTPNAINGQLVITLAGGGSSIVAGATIQVRPVRAVDTTQSAFVQLPVGFFRVPDLRGRSIVGYGTESKTPGVVNPPSMAAGDVYDAATRPLGTQGGEERHKLSWHEMPIHSHSIPSDWNVYYNNYYLARSTGFDVPSATPTNTAGGDLSHNNMQPWAALNYIIKAK